MAQRRTGQHPARFGRYEVIALLGEGGMARAYLALTRAPFNATKLVVIKQIRPEITSDEQFIRMFADEARIALRLSHANVVQTFEVVNEHGEHLLVMEYLDGRSLGHVLRRVGREAMPLDEHVWILTKVLAGLHYAHGLRDFDGAPLSIVHRDVSPANLFVTFDGEVKLLDFGIAKASGALATTREGVIKGKLGYASPEQCLGRAVDHRADLYAVGVMLWEAMARRRRAFGDTELAVLQARVTNAEPGIEVVWPEAPVKLAAISARALARKPEDRYPTALDFQRDLEAYLAALPKPVGSAEVAQLLARHFHDDRAAQAKIISACVNAPSGVDRRSLPTLVSAPPEWAEDESRIVGKMSSRWPLVAAASVAIAAAVLWSATRTRETGPPPTLPPNGGPSAALLSASSEPSAAARAGVPSGLPASPVAAMSAAASAAAPGLSKNLVPPVARRVHADATRNVRPRDTSAPVAIQPGMDLGSPDQPSSVRRIEEQDPYQK
jgi:serine/threonine protein kinase